MTYVSFLIEEIKVYMNISVFLIVFLHFLFNFWHKMFVEMLFNEIK